MAAVKRSLDLDCLVEAELAKLCRDVKCDVCVVPLSGPEMSKKHYGGKIHAKKVERWKDSWINQKKLKMESLPYGEYNDDTPDKEESVKDNVKKDVEKGTTMNGTATVKTESSISKKIEEEYVPDMSSMPLDPRMIDSMDPSTM